MKKIHLALMAAGITFGASAFAFDGAIVKVPASTDHFFVGLEALYLQPTDSNGDLDYSNTVTPGTPQSNNINGIDPSYDWAWRLIAGYKYGAAMDVTFNYFHAKLDNSDSVSATAPTVIYNPNDSSSTQFVASSADVEHKVDQADLTLGLKINPLRCVTLHPFGGLRYARVERDLDTSFTTNPNTNTVENISDTSKFNGIGPIAGMDAAFDIGNGFQIVGRFNAALLVGNMDEDYSHSETLRGTTTTGIQNVDTDSRSRVVPVVDMRLGGTYTYDLGNDSALRVELGYQVSKYHDAIDKISVGNDNSAFAGGSSYLTPTRSTSSLGLNGPYLNVIWRI